MTRAEPHPSPRRTPAERIRRDKRVEALQAINRATLAEAYAAGEAVHIGRNDFWRWEKDGIPSWLIPCLEDLQLLP